MKLIHQSYFFSPLLFLSLSPPLSSGTRALLASRNGSRRISPDLFVDYLMANRFSPQNHQEDDKDEVKRPALFSHTYSVAETNDHNDDHDHPQKETKSTKGPKAIKSRAPASWAPTKAPLSMSPVVRWSTTPAPSTHAPSASPTPETTTTTTTQQQPGNGTPAPIPTTTSLPSTQQSTDEPMEDSTSPTASPDGSSGGSARNNHKKNHVPTLSPSPTTTLTSSPPTKEEVFHDEEKEVKLSPFSLYYTLPKDNLQTPTEEEVHMVVIATNSLVRRHMLLNPPSNHDSSASLPLQEVTTVSTSGHYFPSGLGGDKTNPVYRIDYISTAYFKKQNDHDPTTRRKRHLQPQHDNHLLRVELDEALWDFLVDQRRYLRQLKTTLPDNNDNLFLQTQSVELGEHVNVANTNGNNNNEPNHDADSNSVFSTALLVVLVACGATGCLLCVCLVCFGRRKRPRGPLEQEEDESRKRGSYQDSRRPPKRTSMTYTQHIAATTMKSASLSSSSSSSSSANAWKNDHIDNNDNSHRDHWREPHLLNDENTNTLSQRSVSFWDRECSNNNDENDGGEDPYMEALMGDDATGVSQHCPQPQDAEVVDRNNERNEEEEVFLDEEESNPSIDIQQLPKQQKGQQKQKPYVLFASGNSDDKRDNSSIQEKKASEVVSGTTNLPISGPPFHSPDFHSSSSLSSSSRSTKRNNAKCNDGQAKDKEMPGELNKATESTQSSLLVQQRRLQLSRDEDDSQKGNEDMCVRRISDFSSPRSIHQRYRENGRSQSSRKQHPQNTSFHLPKDEKAGNSHLCQSVEERRQPSQKQRSGSSKEIHAPIQSSSSTGNNSVFQILSVASLEDATQEPTLTDSTKPSFLKENPPIQSTSFPP